MSINTYSIVSPEINYNKTKYLIQMNDNHNNFSMSSQNFQPIWIGLSLISIILFTIGGNTLVCIAVMRERQLQNTTNYFLTSLACTDCLVACLVMPLAAVVEFTGHFPFDAFACNVWSTFDVCCCTSSIWHMSVMSLDRYLTLRYPLKYGRNKRRSLMAYKIIVIWLISFAICLPLFILSLVDSSNVYDEHARACFPSNRIFKLYGTFVAFFIPLVIMVVTYALTMSALRKAHTTKQKRFRGRKRLRTVMNIAAMAVRWRRAVNTVEISVEKDATTVVPQEEVPKSEQKTIPIDYERKRASSLRTDVPIHKPIFTSSQRLHNPSKSSSPMHWIKQRDKQSSLIPKAFNKRRKASDINPSDIATDTFLKTKQASDHRLNPNASNNLQISTKRSRSCVRLLDVDDFRNHQRRSSSIHALIQIRRDSAKISEELANLTAQLSASMSNEPSGSPRPSLSVPGTTGSAENETPTIGQLLAETSLIQPIIIPTSLLAMGAKKRERSHSADIRLPTFDLNDEKTAANAVLPVPNLLVTHESIPALLNHSLEQSSPSNNTDKTYQRIKDWITVTTSSTMLNVDHEIQLPKRCASAMNVNEHTPMLAAVNQRLSIQSKNVRKGIPRIEQLYGQTTAPNAASRPQQLLLVNDQVSSAQNFASIERSSVCSITSSILKARLQNNRPSTTSSIGSTSFQSVQRKRPPRLIDGMSQASFQMVSLDTDESSSCTSSLTQHSATVQSIRMDTTTSSVSSGSRRRRQKFRNLAKSSAGNERKAMRVLLIIFSIFVILWTPFFVINLLSCFMTDIHPILMSIATWLGYCSSCTNPIIYTIFSRAFRRAFVNVLTCRKVIYTHRSSRHSMAASLGRQFSSISKGQIDQR